MSSTKKSSRIPKKTGTGHLHSEQAVARPLILIDIAKSEESVRALTAFLAGLLCQVLSPDKVYLAIIHGRSIALANGVSEKEFNRVIEIIVKNWQLKRRENPFSKMF